jgi:Rhs element Vgr protein
MPTPPSAPHLIVKLDGIRMSQDYEVLSVDVHVEANRIPWAEICFLDGDAATRKFPISESGDFDLGTKVEILMAYVNEPSTQGSVFKGIVTRHAIEFDHRGELLRVECRHAGFLMTQQRRSATFKGKNDGAVIKALFDNYSGRLSVDAGTLTGVQHEELVQYQCTDWDFMMSRCEANGWIVMPEAGNLKILKAPVAEGTIPDNNVLDFNSNEIYTIELALDGADQYESATSSAWNYKTQELVAPVKEKGTKLSPGKLNPGALQRISSGQSQQLFSGIVLTNAELKAWSAAAIARSRLAFFRGRMELQGDAKILPGKGCKINGIGSRFDGTGFITGVRQRMNAGGWTTDVQIGLPASPYHHNKHVTDALAGGLVPGVNGIQIGVVQKFEKEKGGQFRVRVYLPAMGKKENLIWARMSMPSAGKGKDGTRGILFWPEEGDEVIVGFLNDDPRAAIVLGSLYNGVNAPLYPQDEKNAVKGLVTKSGSKLEFDDEKEEILLCTKEKLELRINEKSQSLIIKDKGGSAIFTLGKEGIAMEFEGNKFGITKDGVSIEGAGSKIDLNKSGIVVESKSKLAMTGKSGAALDGGPSVEIKGGMVELK